jgi:hypothetical protein
MGRKHFQCEAINQAAQNWRLGKAVYHAQVSLQLGLSVPQFKLRKIAG